MLLGKITKRKKKRFLAISREAQEPLGPKDWEEQMAILSYGHKNVKWKRYNLIVGNYNQAAYRKLNRIRYNIAEVSKRIPEHSSTLK